MSLTCTKSRVCPPSSKTTGACSFSRREEKMAQTPASVDQRFEERRGAHVVRADVATYLVHGLPDADLRRLVINHVNAFERAADRRGVAHVGAHELRLRVQILRRARLAVHLRD